MDICTLILVEDKIPTFLDFIIIFCHMKVEHEVKLCIKDGLFSVVIVCLLNANYSSGTNSNGQYNMLCTLYMSTAITSYPSWTDSHPLLYIKQKTYNSTLTT